MTHATIEHRTRWSSLRPRWWELAPEAVLAAGLTFFLVDETSAATSAFKSQRALLLMAGVGGGWVIARLVAARWVRWPLVRILPFAAATGLVLATVVLPAYDETRVVETLVASPAPAADTTGPGATGGSGAPTTGEAVTPTTVAAEPVRLRSGPFRGIDHRAMGTVAFYRQPDGRYVVGLEEFDIQPGPAYVVYVVPGTNRQDRSGGTRLDDLRGNAGTQYYEVPAGVTLEEGSWTLLIWCETFGVPVANATPA